jgi:hypothetical protein
LSAVWGIVERPVPGESWELFQRVFRRRRLGLKVAVGAGTATGRCWQRSCSWPGPAVPGNRCRPRPSGRRKYGSKIHLITEGTGPPCQSASRARTCTTARIWPLVRGIPPIRSPCGPYDYRHMRQWLRHRGITHRLARREIEPPGRAWDATPGVVERSGPARWLPSTPPPLRTQADHFLAFASMACTLICQAGGAREGIPRACSRLRRESCVPRR